MCVFQDSMWDESRDHDGGAGGKGVVDGFRNEDKEILIVWKKTRHRTNHTWGEVKIVGRSIEIFTGDVVVRGEWELTK